MPESLVIHYEFILPDKRTEEFEVCLNSQTLELQSGAVSKLSDWTKLDFHQCPNCPLNKEEHSHCPLASGLSHVVHAFSDILSYERVEVKVTTGVRTVQCETDAQKGISSLMGLINAASGCPHLAFFRPMARFHLPMAELDETVYRSTSMYLMGQYMRKVKGLHSELDLAGLSDIYIHLHKVNVAMAERIRAAADKDGSINALIILDLFSQTIPMSIGEKLEEFQTLFEAYLTE